MGVLVKHKFMTPAKLSEIFTDFITKQNLENKRLLLMVSGGVDSVVLLHVAAQTIKPENLAVFHLNHNLRESAEADLIFVQNMCSNLNIKAFTHTLDTQPEKNTESNWRQERKTLSQKVADDFGAARILTAHHATDLVETMIFRLTKGAGPSGLSPFDSSTKPFWKAPKQTLIDYAQAHNLEWHEDESNLNTKFERNLIRAQVLPSLRKITPNLEAVFVREAETFAQLQDFLTQQLQAVCTKELEDQAIALNKFLDFPPSLQTEFLRTIALKTPSQAELTDCLRWLQSQPQGNSKKELGQAKLYIQQQTLKWKL